MMMRRSVRSKNFVEDSGSESGILTFTFKLKQEAGRLELTSSRTSEAVNKRPTAPGLQPGRRVSEFCFVETCKYLYVNARL